MDISTSSILGFIITVLLIPALIYIWNSNRKEVEELKESIKAHRANDAKRRSGIYSDIEQIKVDAEKTKTNYVQRFANLEKQISKEFVITNKAISELSKNVAVLVSKIDD